jgi:hypothetical protein
MAFSLIGAALTFGQTAMAQQNQDFSKVQIKATKVSGNIYMLDGAGGNIGAFVGEDGIVIVDDHPLFRHGLTQLINSDSGYVVCGEASSAPQALSVIRTVKPQLVIVDLGLKGPSGLELIKSIRAEFPRMPVLVLSMHDEPTYAVANPDCR